MAANLVAATLRGGLYTRVVGRRIMFFQNLGSTMDEADRHGAAGVVDGTVVVAETQKASRGRFGRTWVSQPGNLYFSVVFYPTLMALPLLSPLAGVAVVRAIAKTTSLRPRIKWPNDVLIDGKKVAGILVESVISGEEVRYAVLGIGVNVALDPAELGELSTTATSLNATTEREVPREDLLRRLLQELDGLYLALRKGESPIEEWRGLLDTLGCRITASGGRESPAGIVEGITEGVDELGNLQLRLDDGRLITLTTGDVTLVQNGDPSGEPSEFRLPVGDGN